MPTTAQLDRRLRAVEAALEKLAGGIVWVASAIRLTTVPPALSTSRSASFAFVRESGYESAPVQVSLDGAPCVAVSGDAWSCSGLADGAHEVRFWVGAEDNAQAFHFWSVRGEGA
jgi:hypothetical protein